MDSLSLMKTMNVVELRLAQSQTLDTAKETTTMDDNFPTDLTVTNEKFVDSSQLVDMTPPEIIEKRGRIMSVGSRKEYSTRNLRLYLEVPLVFADVMHYVFVLSSRFLALS